ncbi:MAG: 2-keto-4-pentenoate hydratase [Acidimicrobiales bacterium]|nr:2-keto-4-pentenoate hydratase [Hyphomonadaceae bacterium]RZV43495.1 MAG: 2-keto-4-pentenoate hydratase [Acidimicrobiales bacterium]
MTTDIAKAFTDARLNAGGLPDYPGALPTTLDEAYAIQDAAIDMWPHSIGGWKIGGIGGDYTEQFGEVKMAGPVFDNQIYYSDNEVVKMPVFKEGFAAIEPEIVFIMADDVPADKTEWSEDEALSYIGAIHIGVEIASSPFPAINDMGPLVTISDFGNNNGLIIGPELPNWRESILQDWVVETIIDGESVGVTSPPGPMESFLFVLQNTSLRGRPIKKGMAITTGAITGVHQAFSGQSSIIHCSKVDDIKLELIPAT